MKKMLLGEALVAAEIISAGQLEKAINAKDRYPNNSVGQIVAKLYDVPVELIETVFISSMVQPVLEDWFRRELAKKPGPGGINLADMISAIEIDLVSYRRYEGAVVCFVRNEKGYYVEDGHESKLESITVKVDSFFVRTIRRQEVVMKDASFEVTLGNRSVLSVNPGFVAEVRLKLLQAMKAKS